MNVMVWVPIWMSISYLFHGINKVYAIYSYSDPVRLIPSIYEDEKSWGRWLKTFSLLDISFSTQKSINAN